MAYYKFQEGVSSYSGCQDTFLDGFSGEMDWNNGGQLFGYAGNLSGSFIRHLFRWDLSSIPKTMGCVSAALSVRDTNFASRTANNTVNIYKVADANGTWVEGTASDATEVGSCCWNKKVYNTTNWAGSVGMGTAGTDYVNTVLATASFTDGSSGFKTFNFNANGLLVLQSWFGTTGGNGLFLIGDEATSGSITQWDSSETATSANRPILEIYTSVISVNRLRPRIFSPGRSR